MRPSFATLLISILLAASPDTGWASCTAELDAALRALQAESLEKSEDLVERMDSSPLCLAFEKEKARGLLSTRLLSEAVRIDPKLRRSEAVALVRQAANLDIDWRALELWGRILRTNRDFRNATIAFQTAIALIAAADRNSSTAPRGAWRNDASPAQRTNLGREADETRHLAASAPAGVLVGPGAGQTRSNDLGGSLSAAVRGAAGVRVAVPILFEYKSAELTRIGSEAAEEMLRFIASEKPAQITITGHTDHVGSAAYNLELSAQRAATVAAFLRKHGVSAKITTIGKGFSESRVLSEGNDYDQSQIDQLDRRVEFSFGR